MFVLFQRAEENAHTFTDKELKKLWRDLLSDDPQCSESQKEEDGKNKEQRMLAIKGVVDIAKLCLMEINEEDLANKLGRGKILIYRLNGLIQICMVIVGVSGRLLRSRYVGSLWGYQVEEC